MIDKRCRGECLRCRAYVESEDAVFCATWLTNHQGHCSGPRQELAPLSCTWCGVYVKDERIHEKWHENYVVAR